MFIQMVWPVPGHSLEDTFMRLECHCFVNGLKVRMLQLHLGFQEGSTCFST